MCIRDRDYLESALRELKEELGIAAEPEDLRLVGVHEDVYRRQVLEQPSGDVRSDRLHCILRVQPGGSREEKG